MNVLISKITSLIFFLFFVQIVVSSCASSNPNSKNIGSVPNTPKKIVIHSHQTYRRIFQNSGVLRVFKLEKIDIKSNTVKIRLSPLVDHEAGLLMTRKDLLNKFNHVLSSKVSNKTGLDINNVTLLIKMGRCDVELMHENNVSISKKHCYRDVLITDEPKPQRNLISKLEKLLKCLSGGGCVDDSSSLNKSFITRDLLLRFCQSEFKNIPCNVFQDAKADNIYHLNGIRKSGYVTDDNCENLSMTVHVLLTSKEAEVPKTVSRLKLIGKYFPKGFKFSQCPSSSSVYTESLLEKEPVKLIAKEVELTMHLKQFINNEAKTSK